MEPSSVITWGIGSALVGAFLAGVAVITFLGRKLTNLRTDLIGEIHKSRSDGDKKIDSLRSELATLASRQQAHELHVAMNLATRSAVTEAMERIERAVGVLSDRVDARLVRMEERLERATATQEH